MNTLKTSAPQSKPPKILHVVISMVVGGAERLVYDMVRYPAFAEQRPVVCCLDAVGELGEKLQQEGYQVYCNGRRAGFDRDVITWIREIIQREKITVVHAHQYSPLCYAAPAAFLAGRIKVVYTEHGRFYPDRKSWKRSLINPLLAFGIDHLVSISASTAQAMATYDNFPRNRIKVIHNGVDVSQMNPPIDLAAKRRELGLSETCRIIGTAARLNEIKNIPMMLRVLRLVLKDVPDCCLLIAGQGEQLVSLQALAAELEIADHVNFVGLRFDLPEIYRLFDAFLLTSFSEGISVTLLEAMASGVPAVVTDVGGNGEVVVEGKTGYLVPVDDDEMMAERVVKLLLNSSLSVQFGLKGQKRINKAFSFDRMINNYFHIYW